MYKLIAIDMDGTLLRSDRTISERTKEVIKKAREKGVQVVLASGRPIDGLQKYLRELDLLSENDYVLSFNGALVQNSGTREVIASETLTGKELKELYALSQQLEVNIHAFSSEGCITPKMSRYTEHEVEMNDLGEGIIRNYAEISDDEKIIKIMFVDEPEILEPVIKAVPQEVKEKYTSVRSAPFFYEFLHIASNKGAGVKALADHLGIKREEIMTFGDAENDKHMIEYAGKGVAMGNAFDEIKEIADYITKTNDEDGVAHAIEQFILQAE